MNDPRAPVAPSTPISATLEKNNRDHTSQYAVNGKKGIVHKSFRHAYPTAPNLCPEVPFSASEPLLGAGPKIASGRAMSKTPNSANTVINPRTHIRKTKQNKIRKCQERSIIYGDIIEGRGKVTGDSRPARTSRSLSGSCRIRNPATAILDG